jgi:molybdopterin/thiamine biosynthesis adenylyltransferase
MGEEDFFCDVVEGVVSGENSTLIFNKNTSLFSGNNIVIEGKEYEVIRASGKEIVIRYSEDPEQLLGKCARILYVPKTIYHSSFKNSISSSDNICLEEYREQSPSPPSSCPVLSVFCASVTCNFVVSFFGKQYRCPQLFTHSFSTEPLDFSLKGLKIFQVGCGATGNEFSKIALQLGCKEICLFDGDRYSLTNMNRQFLCGEDGCGKNKAEVSKNNLAYWNEFSSVINDNRMNISNINWKEYKQQFLESDVVAITVDNMECRYQMSALCKFYNKIMIECGTDGLHMSSHNYNPSKHTGGYSYREAQGVSVYSCTSKTYFKIDAHAIASCVEEFCSSNPFKCNAEKWFNSMYCEAYQSLDKVEGVKMPIPTKYSDNPRSRRFQECFDKINWNDVSLDVDNDDHLDMIICMSEIACDCFQIDMEKDRHRVAMIAGDKRSSVAISSSGASSLMALQLGSLIRGKKSSCYSFDHRFLSVHKAVPSQSPKECEISFRQRSYDEIVDYLGGNFADISRMILVDAEDNVYLMPHEASYGEQLRTYSKAVKKGIIRIMVESNRDGYCRGI